MSADELQSIGSVVTGMIRALPVFTGKVAVPAEGAHDLPTTRHIAELITLAMQVLQREPSQVRMKLLLSKENGHPGLVYAVTSYLVSKLSVAPGEQGPEANKRAIQCLRVLVLKTLSQLVALTSFDHVPDSAARLGPTCAVFLHGEFEDLQVPAVLIGISSASKVPQDIKVAAAECLFVYSLRNAAGRASLVSEPECLSQLFAVLQNEPSHMVRNYIAACVRECTTTHGAEVEAAGLSSAAPQIIGTDGSADVRVLLLECLEVVVKTQPLLKLDPRLAETLVHLLAFKDALPGVTDAACHFVDTFVSIEADRCFERASATPQLPLGQLPCQLTIRFVGCGGVETLVNGILAQQIPKTAALTCRALRRLVQHAHHRIGVGRRVANSSVSSLFGLLVGQTQEMLLSDAEIHPGGAEGSTAEEFKAVAMVELAIALAMTLAQSSELRAFVQHSITLQNPEYATAVRTSLLAFLDRAAPEYFAELAVVDAQSGRRLNVLDGVEWDEEGWPTKESLCQSLNGVQACGIMPQSMQYSLPEIQEMRMCRFTQVLLRYAIHLTLSEDVDLQSRAELHERSKSTSRAGSAARPSTSPVNNGPSPHALIHQRAPSEPAPSAFPPPPSWSVPKPQSAGTAPQASPAAPHHPPATPSQPPHSTRRELLPDSMFHDATQDDPAPPAPAQPAHPHPVPSRTPALPAGAAPMYNSAAQHYDPGAGAFQGAPPNDYAAGYPQPPPPQGRGHPHAAAAPPSRSSSQSQPPIGFAPLRRTSRLPTPEEIIPPQKFVANEAALQFAVQFSKHYTSSAASKRSHSGAPRWVKPASRNPWAPPVKKFPVNKSWTLDDLRAGDLFMFAIPHEQLSVAAVESVLYAAQKHAAALKRAFLVTPQRQKSRRWALFDLLNMATPHMQDLLIRLAKVLVAVGEKNAMVPIFMLREQEIARGEQEVHPGNLAEVVEQLTYYATVHVPPRDDELDVINKLHTLSRTDPEAFADLSDSSTSTESQSSPERR
eukprot:TRINITY_DN22261_c0_g1_i1.p1 TRINITY_DN22261_c0_g1~~TRINITY_DN22261_c0_g1_i1.p1  ORF type:complete len:1024 (+),score=354.31 TRINITY_DN22261_c0_g1_i1:72-3074(+)